MKDLAKAAQVKPEVITDQRPKPKVVKVEGGGGAPTQTDEEAASYNTLFEKWSKTKSPDDFNKLMKFKMGDKMFG